MSSTDDPGQSCPLPDELSSSTPPAEVNNSSQSSQLSDELFSSTTPAQVDDLSQNSTLPDAMEPSIPSDAFHDEAPDQNDHLLESMERVSSSTPTDDLDRDITKLLGEFTAPPSCLRSTTYSALDHEKLPDPFDDDESDNESTNESNHGTNIQDTPELIEAPSPSRQAHKELYPGMSVYGSSAPQVLYKKENRAYSEARSAVQNAIMDSAPATPRNRTLRPLMTPPPTKSPEVESKPSPATPCPTRASPRLKDTSENHETVVKREEFPHISRASKVSDDSDDSDDEPIFIKQEVDLTGPKRIEVEEGGWNDFTGDTDDDEEGSDDDISLYFPPDDMNSGPQYRPDDLTDLNAIMDPIIEEHGEDIEMQEHDVDSENDDMNFNSGEEDVVEEMDAVDDDVRDELFVPQEEVRASRKSKQGKKNKNDKNEKKKQTRRSPAKTARDYHQRKYDDEIERGKKRPTWPRISDPMRSAVKKKTSRKSSKKQSENATLRANLIAHYASGGFLPENGDGGGEEDEDLDPALAALTRSTKKDRFDQLLATSTDSDARRTKANISDLKEMCMSFGHDKVTAVGENLWKHKDMKAVFPHHQLMGGAWMVKQECSPDGPRGGLLADVMGLGKTIQTILLIVANPPPAGTPRNQCQTLIVVPPGILQQWEDEIENMAGDTLKRVMVYKESMNIKEAFIEVADIVLTSHWQVQNSSPPPLKKGKGRSKTKKTKHLLPDSDDEGSEPISNNHAGGLLHNRDWYRVVVDEFHVARNHKNLISMALNGLRAKYRWALTGTPLFNNLQGKSILLILDAVLDIIVNEDCKEFYPYFRFLKDKLVPSNYEQFKAVLCNPEDPLGMRALIEHVNRIGLRRTMNDRILGKRILKLPKATIETILVKFSGQEKILYRVAEEKFRELINENLDKLDERSALTYMIVQVLRARQLTTHPALVDRELKIMFSDDELRLLLEKFRKVGVELAERTKGWIQEKIEEPAPTEEELIAAKNVPRCQICRDVPDENPQFIDLKGCQHLFCEECITSALEMQLSDGRDDVSCPGCNKKFVPERNLKPAKQHKDLKLHIKKMVKTEKGKDASGFVPLSLETKWMQLHDAGKMQMLASAKLSAVVGKVQEWLREAPEDKIIIFTQFRGIQGILGRELEKLGIKFLYYSGDMDLKKRSKTVKDMREKSGLKVLIAGLKCGGQGLNLTFANRMISIDLWWNSAVESQAFGRGYRMGQKKETHFVRFVVTSSIDHRLRKLQEEKDALIAKGLPQEDPTAEQYLGLFGRVVKDQNGNVIRVEADYSDDEDDDDAMGGLGRA